MKTTTQPNLIAACMLSIFLITERNAPAAELPGASDQSKGVKVLIIGHSLTGNLNALKCFAAEAGHPAHNQGHYSMLGTSVMGHYRAGPNLPWQPKTWRQLYFEDGQKWDALVLSAQIPT